MAEYPKDESSKPMFVYMLSQWAGNVEESKKELVKMAINKMQQDKPIGLLTRFHVPKVELESEGFYYIGPSNPDVIEIDAESNGVCVVFRVNNLLTIKGFPKHYSYKDDMYWVLFSLWIRQ